MYWNGFVDIFAGDVIDGVDREGVGAFDSFDWLSFLKNGFFVSLLYADGGREVTVAVAGGIVVANVGSVSDTATDRLDIGREGSSARIWLLIGVVSRASSSDESSSPKLSSCN
jgi:hypothetical protein